MYAYITMPVYSFQNFIYKVPLNLQAIIYPGTCVNVKFRNKPNQGYIVSLTEKTNYKGKILSIDSISKNNYNIPIELWKTLEWTSEYYIAPFSQVIKSAIPYNFNTKYKSFDIEYICINKKGIELYNNFNRRAPLQKKILLFLTKQHQNYIQLSELSKLGSSYRFVCKNLIESGYIDLKIKNLNPFRKYISQGYIPGIRKSC